ncbi:gas vesicle protein [Micromonospora zamorensis]|uniref:gas vesicle protein n=1 Tax=Micromonospora zamorensis TaxID=709883 RepID=UPI003D99654E
MTAALAPNSADDPLSYRAVALVDLLDRVLATGVVISGDITLAIADVTWSGSRCARSSHPSAR